ncbi:alpha/beta hydrolase [Aureococcus anophagefferens]|nr:alpha/beta hydrolase [Aureococcus anophagefferens]
MGDKSCAPAAISAHWVTSHVANVVVWVLTTLFAVAWSVYAYVAGRVRSPIGVAFVAAALLFILFYRRAARVGQRCKPTSRPCDATVQPADAEGVSMVAVATAAPDDAPDVATAAPVPPPGHALQNRRFFVESRIYSP